MTNEEALKAQFSNLNNVSAGSIQFHLTKQSLDAAAEYIPVTNDQAIDMALAGLLFVLCTNPKSISELDFSVTQQDVDDMLKLRASLFAQWGVVDPKAPKGPTVTGKSVW